MTTVGIGKDVPKLEARYSIVKTFRFAIAGALGFAVTELVLSIGLLLIYGRLTVPHANYSSVELLGLDVLSLVVGVSASFLINERITVRVQEIATESRSRLGRFLKFQAVSGVGNTGIVIVQLLLLSALAVSPLVSTIVGAVVTYPIVYFISIKYVWKGHHIR